VYISPIHIIQFLRRPPYLHKEYTISSTTTMTPLNPASVYVRDNTNTIQYIKTIHAFASVGMCYNVTFILLHISAVAPFAPLFGLATGCATIYLFSNGYR